MPSTTWSRIPLLHCFSQHSYVIWLYVIVGFVYVQSSTPPPTFQKFIKVCIKTITKGLYELIAPFGSRWRTSRSNSDAIVVFDASSFDFSKLLQAIWWRYRKSLNMFCDFTIF